MPRKPKPPRDPFAGWKTFGLPAFAAALAPWQSKITEAALIPEYYEPKMTILASVLGPLICFCLWLTCDRLTRRALVRLCLGGLAWLVAALAGCLALDATVDVVWLPEKLAATLLGIFWPFLYLSLFAALAVAVVGGLLLAEKK